MVGVIGKAIKGFGKALKSRGRKPGVFDKVIGKGVVDRNVKSKEVFKTIQGLRKKPKGKFSTFPSEIVRTLKRGVVDRNVKSKEVFKTIQGLKKKGIDQVTGKPFSKATQEHMHKQTLRHKTMKQMGLTGPKYAPSGKKTKTGAIKLEEVWKYNPYKKGKK